ncbi:MAG: ribose 5-phosphate isomerase B [Planctomycetes bacterium]|nr:ribose 5-phosphate isomerase B [Planctomycetota bacterium]
MKIAIASDHAGFDLKEELVRFLQDKGHQVANMGPLDKNRVDYPDFAVRACERLKSGEAQRVVLVCGSGIGMAISANKVSGCRAAVIHNEWEGEMCRRHNDANVACFGARSMGPEIVQRSLLAFLAAEFEGGRHAERVAKMNRLDGSARE